MDTLALKTFVWVAQTGSFSRAADGLHLSQPAVSKRIAGLERQLAQPLLDRVGRRILLTEAGRTLLPHARNILNALDDAQRDLSRLHADVQGHLAMGTSHHIGLHRLPPILRQFSQACPEVELDIQFMDSEQACDAVLNGELEMAVVTLPPEADKRLSTQLLWPDPLDVMVSRSHPLAHQSDVSLLDLAAHPAVLPDEQTYTHRIIRSALEAAGTPLKVRLATNYLETLKMLVSIGMGWSVLPRRMLDEELQAIPVPGLDMRRELGIVRHRDRAISAAAKAFVDMASQR